MSAPPDWPMDLARSDVEINRDVMARFYRAGRDICPWWEIAADGKSGNVYSTNGKPLARLVHSANANTSEG